MSRKYIDHQRKGKKEWKEKGWENEKNENVDAMF